MSWWTVRHFLYVSHTDILKSLEESQENYDTGFKRFGLEQLLRHGLLYYINEFMLDYTAYFHVVLGSTLYCITNKICNSI